jgi:uncharacterized membrane protein affecting hemolysin expression
MEGLMRVLLVALMIGLVAAPVLAQGSRGKEQSEEQKQKEQEKRRKAHEAEKKYKGALDTIPEKKKVVDPWSKVR